MSVVKFEKPARGHGGSRRGAGRPKGAVSTARITTADIMKDFKSLLKEKRMELFLKMCAIYGKGRRGGQASAPAIKRALACRKEWRAEYLAYAKELKHASPHRLLNNMFWMAWDSDEFEVKDQFMKNHGNRYFATAAEEVVGDPDSSAADALLAFAQMMQETKKD